MVPLGIQFSASGLVGYNVGARNAKVAKCHAVAHLVYAVFLMLIIMMTIKLNEDWVASLFTDHPDDIYYIKEVLNIISVYLVLDSVHGVNTGIVRALGKQFLASIATICCYYFIGLPLALVLGFKLEMGVVGFWSGFTVALTLQDIFVSIIIVCADWNVGNKAQEELEAKMQGLVDNDNTLN